MGEGRRNIGGGIQKTEYRSSEGNRERPPGSQIRRQDEYLQRWSSVGRKNLIAREGDFQGLSHPVRILQLLNS
jgi:hypothetical protein